jgi:transposase
VVVEVDGERLKAWEFLLRLMYSGREFAWLYERCDQLAFLDGHVRAFSYLDGVVRRCVYDYVAGYIIIFALNRYAVAIRTRSVLQPRVCLSGYHFT